MEQLDYQATFQKAFESILIFAVIGFVIWGITLYLILRSASRSSNIVYNQVIIVRLLKLIAQKNGATDDEINNLLNK